MIRDYGASQKVRLYRDGWWQELIGVIYCEITEQKFAARNLSAFQFYLLASLQ